MHPRHRRIALAVAVMVLVLVAFWVALRSGSAHPRIGVALGTAHGKFPEQPLLSADDIAVAWITNTGSSRITLTDPCVQFENAAGRVITDQGSSWNQKAYSTDLSAGAAAWLASGFDRDRQRLKFIFEYRRSGGAFLKAAAKVAGVLPLNRLPQRSYAWLRQNGLVDGTLHLRYESSWIANPQGGANGRQPFSSYTNRTSAAAASRGSP
jgi:hypothetical protein